MYKILRSILFLFDPEQVHYFSMKALRIFCKFQWIKKLFSKKFSSVDAFNLFGLQFLNRVGLAAGFDKNAQYLNELQALGFGFIEIGTVTPLPQKGNDKPRLFRLSKDKALINRMGFNNDGVEKIAFRLKEWNKKDSTMIIGGNIGKNKITPNENAWLDYEICFQKLYGLVDYFVVNVSSPNTPGLRALQEKNSLRKILANLQKLNVAGATPVPILLKIAPDLSKNELDDVIELAIEIKLDGLIATNTTISRENLVATSLADRIGPGGLSGLPVKQRSTEVVKYIHQKTNGKIPVIASGGIFKGVDAQEKIDAGASLVQVWTGFIYEGPSIVKNISTYLARAKHKKK